MADGTDIEWADATITPFPGCSDALMPDGNRGLAQLMDGVPEWTGEVGYAPQDLDKVRGWTRPRRIFVEPMGDIAHESLTPERWAPFFALLLDNAERKQPHTFYLLTKRAKHLRFLLEAMRDRECSGCEEIYWKAMAWVVCMTTTENQAAADYRVPELLRCPALHFGVSAEPLVGPLDLTPWFGGNGDCCDCGDPECSGPGSRGCSAKRLGWLVTGGWSGPAATPSHPKWFRDLRNQAAAAGVPFLFKQWGEFAYLQRHSGGRITSPNGYWPVGRLADKRWDGPRLDEWMSAVRVGKRIAGRLLDGVEHNGFPVVGTAR